MKFGSPLKCIQIYTRRMDQSQSTQQPISTHLEHGNWQCAIWELLLIIIERHLTSCQHFIRSEIVYRLICLHAYVFTRWWFISFLALQKWDINKQLMRLQSKASPPPSPIKDLSSRFIPKGVYVLAARTCVFPKYSAVFGLPQNLSVSQASLRCCLTLTHPWWTHRQTDRCFQL